MRHPFRAILILVCCTALAGCGAMRLGRKDRPAPEPAAASKPVAAEKAPRRRGALKFLRRGKAEAPPPVLAPPPESVAKTAAPPREPATSKVEPAPPPARAVAPAPDSNRPRVEPKIARPKLSGPGEVVALSPSDARRRAASYLAAKGYSMQPDEEGRGVLITDPLLSTASIDHLANCGGKRFARAILHSTELEMRFVPDGAGARVTVGVLFTEVRQGKVSKGMSKAACKSRGVLEAEILGALKR
jgi:hypothetical protein